MNSSDVKARLQKYASKDHAQLLQKYFKTGKGQYAEGDIFLGLTVPQVRKVAKTFSGLGISEIQTLLKSKFHEGRLTALLILVDQFKNGDSKQKENIFNFYLKNTKYINNWDLVDLSAPRIVGDWLAYKNGDDSDIKLLEKFAVSNNLWERRIAIISTFAFIKIGKVNETLKVSNILLADKHDLIHKAVGWALREVGKKNQILLEKFLKENYSNLPRTTLRYAIEKFTIKKRHYYLQLPKQKSSR